MRRIRISKFVTEETEIEWLVEGLLPNVGWTLLVGRKGYGKTTFAMQMCASIQDGKEFLGRKTTKTDVLYVQCDSPTLEWREMLKRIAPKSNAFTVVDMPRKALSNPTYVTHLCNIVEKTNPGFLVFDSLYNLSTVNINTDAVLNVINIMNEIASSRPWLLIHHPPHGESRASGHNSLGGNCSNEWHLLKTMLVIDKGRLVKDENIILTRDAKGLWGVKQEAIEDNDDIMNLPVE